MFSSHASPIIPVRSLHFAQSHNDFNPPGSLSSVPVFILCVSSLLSSFWELSVPKPLFCFFLFPILPPHAPFSPHSSVVMGRSVRVLQTQRAPPTLGEGVLPRPLGGPTLGGGEADVRTIIQRIFPLWPALPSSPPSKR